jgi:hypothetical protein
LNPCWHQDPVSSSRLWALQVDEQPAAEKTAEQPADELEYASQHQAAALLTVSQECACLFYMGDVIRVT